MLHEVLLYDEELKVPLDPARTCISWRGDGKYVATSVAHSSAGAAAGTVGATEDETDLRIWDRESFGLVSRGEQVTGLEPVLGWQPNGRHLYAAQHVDGAAHVRLYERNGLQHGSFDIPGTGRGAWQPAQCPTSPVTHTSERQ